MDREWQTGPPMAPRITASAFLAAWSASSVKGEPVASIEAFAGVQRMYEYAPQPLSAYSRRPTDVPETQS